MASSAATSSRSGDPWAKTRVYVGTLTISDVRPHEAAGLFEPAGRGKKIEAGDNVDTKILK